MDVRIVVLVGEPGSGKTTIADGLLALRPNVYRTLISNTTREKRPTDGPRDYRFVTARQIEQWYKNGELAWEMAHSAGNIYATRLDDIDAALADSTHCYISVLVPETAAILYGLYPQKVLPIRVSASEALLPERLRSRGATEADIGCRLAELERWKRAFQSKDVPYRTVVNNNSIESAVQAADQLIQGQAD